MLHRVSARAAIVGARLWLSGLVLLGACKDEDVPVDGGAPVDAASSTPDAEPRPPGPLPQTTWNPNYPGQAIGCETSEANLALRECVDHVFPRGLVVDPATVCDPDETVHESGCPTSLSTESGPVVAACQDHVEILDPSDFPEFINVLTYENWLVERGRETPPGGPETPVEVCERFVREFDGTLCPLDADFTDVALDRVDCRLAAP